MDVLLTFVGNRDPFVEDDYPSSDRDGPVLSLLRERTFAAVHLFTTRNVLLNASGLKRVVRERALCPRVEEENLEISDPTGYEELLPQMWRAAEKVQGSYPAGTEFWIATSSGTPQMHASWLVLALSRRIRGRLLKVTPRRFLKEGQPAVSELFPQAPLFSVELPEEGGERRLRPVAGKRAAAGSAAPAVEFPLPAASTDDLALLRVENQVLRRALQGERGDSAFSRLVGWNGSLRQVVENAARIASEPFTVLLLGETGTGKELLARCIHGISPFREGPFEPVNCGALPVSLAESLLFGHVRGAFTDARCENPGHVGRAENGTLFLDEIGDLPPPLQVKLLRLLQEKEVTPVGGRPRKVNLRVVAATNKDLESEIKAGSFRSDLFYRLEFPISVPPLRERRQDIATLAARFMDRLNADRSRPKRLAAETVELLQQMPWPGNVRELENAIKRLYFTTGEETIQPAHFEQAALAACDTQVSVFIPPEGLNLPSYLQELEREYYRQALVRTGNNKAEAARLLSIHPKTFQKACREKYKL